MYRLLNASSRHRVTEQQFISQYQAAARTATVESLSVARVGNPNGRAVPVAMVVRTVAFGTIAGDADRDIRRQRRRRRRSASPRSCSSPACGHESCCHGSLARPAGDVAGPRRERAGRGPEPDLADPHRGLWDRRFAGPDPAELVASYAAQGYPPDAKVGLDGLERIFQSQLAGTPGGTLRAGTRVLATNQPGARAMPVRTSIDPSLEQAAVTALGSNYGGIAAMDPRTGQILALAGLAFSAVQPPGSTMKIITSTGALQAGIVKLSDTLPDPSAAVIDGYTLHNASGEACGGTLLNAFAVSCNSVFAPLGVKLGAQRLVATAERFGFNHPVPIPGATESTIPTASQIGGALSVGSSAIGQGQVQASALEMTDVAATIAMRGRRPVPTLATTGPPKFVRVTSAKVAHEVQEMMIAVVQYGTGTCGGDPGRDRGRQDRNRPDQQQQHLDGHQPQQRRRLVRWLRPRGGAPDHRRSVVRQSGLRRPTAAPAIRQVIEAALQGR